MATKFIGMKELRQNMANIAKEAEKKKQRLIILRKNEPIFELRPLSGDDALMESLRRDIEEAQGDVELGNVYTHEAILKRSGL